MAHLSPEREAEIRKYMTGIRGQYLVDDFDREIMRDLIDHCDTLKAEFAEYYERMEADHDMNVEQISELTAERDSAVARAEALTVTLVKARARIAGDPIAVSEYLLDIIDAALALPADGGRS